MGREYRTRPAREYRRPHGQLSSEQFAIVTQAARALPFEKREAFAQRVAALLQSRSGRATDADVAAVAQQALGTLIVSAA